MKEMRVYITSSGCPRKRKWEEIGESLKKEETNLTTFEFSNSSSYREAQVDLFSFYESVCQEVSSLQALTSRPMISQI